jgi:hypothetical protein
MRGEQLSADSFGFGPCKYDIDNGWPCSQAAIDDSGLCYYHSKLAHRMTRRVEQEDGPTPAPRKKETK